MEGDERLTRCGDCVGYSFHVFSRMMNLNIRHVSKPPLKLI